MNLFSNQNNCVMLVACVVVSMFLVSVCGTILNTYLFWNYIKKSGAKSAFLKLCLAKTVPNTIVCLVFLLWVVPLTALSVQYQDIPASVNRFLGQFSGFGAYVAGPIIQLFMAINRCSVIFFPTKCLALEGSRNANIAIVIVLLIALLYSGVGFLQPNCGFVYDPELLRWKSEETDCAFQLGQVLFYTVIALTAVSNTLNVLTFVKLCCDKTNGLNNEAILIRRKKRIRLFAQSAIQDLFSIPLHFNVSSPHTRNRWVSFLGVSVNSFLFWRFTNRETKGFLRYCLAKTIPNVIVCLSFLFWAAPLTAFSVTFEQIPRPVNVLIGQVSGFGAYVCGALLELAMAFNRWSVIYFPFYEIRYTDYVVFFIFMVSSVYTVMGLVPLSCGFVYDPDAYLWRPENTECADHMEDVILYTIYAVAALSNSLNLATFLKLCYGRVAGITVDERSRRRKRRVMLFVQSVIQNCLHVIDMINFNFIVPLNPATWFQFIFNSMSLLTIHTLDGFVMLVFHPEVQPRRKKSSSILVIHPPTS